MKIRNILFLTLLLIIVTIFIPNYVNAGVGDRFTVDNIEYVIIEENGTDNFADVYQYIGNGEKLIIPETIEHNGKDFKVISIGYFFHSSIGYNQSVTSITIPKSISHIADEAFNGFDKLKEFKVSEENAKFSSIQGVLYNKDKTELMCYPKNKEGTTYKIPNTVTTVHKKAFEGSKLTTITIPNSMTEIGNAAFEGAKALTSVTIPKSVTTIGDYAFFGCTSLTSITIPESVTTIKDNVFYDCISLTNITIPKSVTTIGSNAFLYCAKLKEIKVEEENQNYCSVDGILFNKDKTELVCYPDNKAGASYEIPGTVITIGSNAFNHCNKLTKITIPNSVTTIKSSAFDECKGLKIISIPQSVTSIEDYAFVWCGNLKSIIVLGSPDLIGYATFRGCDLLTIYCKEGSNIVQYAKDNNMNYKETVIYSITNKLTNLSSDGELYTTPELGDYTVTLTANKGYKLPSTISVKVDGQELPKEQYTYTHELTTGKLIIPVTGNIQIEASGERKYEVIFDANGGIFTEERKILIYEDWKYTDEQGLEEPTRKGYNFIGYYTKNGASFKHIMAESGIEEDMVFYAKWKEKVLKQIKVFEHSENQKFVIGTDKELVFELDNNRGEGKVFVDGKELSEKDGYYTWNFVEGIYPSIALSEEYIKTLGLGKHTIKFIVDEEFYAETTFTIVENKNVEDQEQEDLESDVEDSILNTDKEENNSEKDKIENNSEKDKLDNNLEKEENKFDNPKTGDNILLFTGLFIISIIGIFVTTKFRKKL